MTWSQEARKVIAKALDDAAALNLTGRAREKFVQDRYPFGPRQYWPYRAWCKAFGEMVKGKRKPERIGRHKALPPLEGQGTLFDGQES